MTFYVILTRKFLKHLKLTHNRFTFNFLEFHCCHEQFYQTISKTCVQVKFFLQQRTNMLCEKSEFKRKMFPILYSILVNKKSTIPKSITIHNASISV